MNVASDHTRDKTPALPYMPQLDALRAFAVGAVLIHHFWNAENLPLGLGKIPWGFLGVRLFFVISGFLITGILVRSRDDSKALNQSRWFAVRQFYARRFLRIFPLYYFVIALTMILNVPPAREIFVWLVTYTFNIQLSMQGWFPENFAHFWTLSVEEQFYIFWPWLVLFAPRKRLIPVICVVISLGPLYRLYAVANELNEVATYCLTFSALDTLGLGSLLALVSHATARSDIIEKVLTRVVLPVGIAANVTLLVLLYSLNQS